MATVTIACNHAVRDSSILYIGNPCRNTLCSRSVTKPVGLSCSHCRAADSGGTGRWCCKVGSAAASADVVTAAVAIRGPTGRCSSDSTNVGSCLCSADIRRLAPACSSNRIRMSTATSYTSELRYTWPPGATRVAMAVTRLRCTILRL